MRCILHCDLNSFFASVECLKNPKLKNVPMAVCGDPNIRHGVILAKNDIAKKYGIYTTQTVYAAKKMCKNLVLVNSNHADYEKYSILVNNIYLKYTDKVEKFGIDESFLDVTGSIKLFGDGEKIANLIKEDVKNTLGLTISVGVSFNKPLAKLGSDLKKPDAVSVLDFDNYKKIIYPLPVTMLLFVGKSTNLILYKMRIETIGDLANCDKNKLIKKLGKQGEVIHNYANGIDFEEVRKFGIVDLPKSIGKGTTFASDIDNIEELENIVRRLTNIIVKSLRDEKFKCRVVSLNIKDSDFFSINRQKKIHDTDIFKDIVTKAIEILKENYIEGKKIRAVTVTITDLVSLNSNDQLNIFDMKNVNEVEIKRNQKLETANDLVYNLSDKYGKNKATFASLIKK